jgi:hypothetical protein
MTNQIIDFTTRRPLAGISAPKYRREQRRELNLHFDSPIEITSRPEALALLDDLIRAYYVYDKEVAYRALRDAIAREVV